MAPVVSFGIMLFGCVVTLFMLFSGIFVWSWLLRTGNISPAVTRRDVEETIELAYKMIPFWIAMTNVMTVLFLVSLLWGPFE